MPDEVPQFVDPDLPGTHWSMDGFPAGPTPRVNRAQMGKFMVRTSGQLVGSQPLTAEFSDCERAVHDVRIDPGAIARPHGYSCDVTLSGWDHIDYIAFGFLQDGTYHHVKRRHVKQDCRLTSTVFVTSLLLRAQGAEWSLSDGPFELRLFIKGSPGVGVGRAQLHRCSIWHATPGLVALDMENPVARHSVDAVRRFRDRPDTRVQIAQDASRFIETGEVAIIPGTYHSWPVEVTAPVDTADNATLRYSWHALNPAARLAEQQGPNGAALRRAAMEIALGWVGSNVMKAPDDLRYAWYDHGSAERLLSILVILAQSGRDPVRSMRGERTLAWQVLEHARLLASPEFYAANQNSIFHNHAWFQDIALLVASTCFDCAEAVAWRNIALARLHTQFDRLIISEGNIAVFSENSIAYHHGITAMVELVAYIETAIGGRAVARGLVEPLRRWEELLRYPDGRPPSQGDSYRIPPSAAERQQVARPIGSYLFPSAGYALVHGRDGSTPYSLFLYNSGANATHKHHDNASFTLGMAGVEWLVDPSFYSHDYADPVPAYLRGRWAHNALIIAGAEYSIAPGLTELHGVTGPSFAFTAIHRAYGSVQVHREVRGDIDDLDLRLEDWLVGDLGPHQEVEICFHLGEGVVLHRTEHPDRILLRHGSTASVLEMTLPSSDWYTVEGLGQEESSTSLIGHGFQQAVDSVTVHVRVSRSSGVRHQSRIRLVSPEEAVLGS
jgi:hypothetical protein